MRRFKILHIDPEKEWGGGEAQVLGLTTYLQRSEHNSVVAADPHGRLYQRLCTAGLPASALRIRHHVDFLAGLSLRRLVHNGKYDLVHFHTARAHALSPWLQGLKVKRIVTRRMDYPLSKGWGTHFLYCRSVDAVVAISTSVQKALLAGGVPASQLRIIPSGIDTTRFERHAETRTRVRQAYGFEEHEKVILAVGALVARKSYCTLLAAAHHLQASGRQLRYLICGEGPLRSALEAEARALGLAHTVRFVGFFADIPAVLAAADLFVHVPLHEGLGVAVIEALAAGLPVVASRVGGIPELIADEETGLLVPPQNPLMLASALERLVSNSCFASHLGRSGQVRTRIQFDIVTMAQKNETLYLELLNSP